MTVEVWLQGSWRSFLGSISHSVWLRQSSYWLCWSCL